MTSIGMGRKYFEFGWSEGCKTAEDAAQRDCFKTQVFEETQSVISSLQSSSAGNNYDSFLIYFICEEIHFES